jgi:DNA-directed RNA polymerase beta subunit
MGACVHALALCSLFTLASNIPFCTPYLQMTIGKLLEMLYGSVGLVSGFIQDATPFLEVDARSAIEDLMKGGYGLEHDMISGITGLPLAHPWFVGPCFYQRLKHMVLDKVAARSRGLRAILTRQPMEGRQNQGGQKMGEMERDALIAHGSAMVLDDRSRIASDAFKASVCRKCGTLGKVQEESLAGLKRGLSTSCRSCGTENAFSVLDTTYCYAGLLLGELEAMNIGVKHKFRTTEAPTASSKAPLVPLAPLAPMAPMSRTATEVPAFRPMSNIFASMGTEVANC